jgi:hypothetical protein
MSAYETLDPVLSLGWANEAGMCMNCGGRRSIPKCACSHTHSIEPAINHTPLERTALSGVDFKQFIKKS